MIKTSKHVTQQNHFVIAKFKKLKTLKQMDKKIQELSPSLRYWFSRQQIFFQLDLTFITDSRTGFVPDSTLEAATGAVLLQTVFLKTLQISQENTYCEVFF